MTTLANQYLEYRRSFGYRLKSEGELLLRFAQYADQSKHRGPLTSELAIRWAREPKDAARLYWARRLEVVRCFARYVAVLDPRTEIPPPGVFGKAHSRPQPYVYSAEELARLLTAAHGLRSTKGLRAKTYVTLFSLLACTGLRISEALHLKCSDVDLQRGILTIRESKYHKSRLVPLHASAKRALSKYVVIRNTHHPYEDTHAFFVSDGGLPLPYSTVVNTFRNLRQKAGVIPKPGERSPRIHDLRHTFTCRRLLEWYREGADVERNVPLLSIYLGHAKVTDTYWYLTGFPELLTIATARFETFGARPKGGRK